MNQPMNQQCVETSNERLSPYIDGAETFIRELCAAGGPEPHQYPHVARFFDDIHQAEQAGLADDADKLALRQTFGQAMGLGTMQGRAWLTSRNCGAGLSCSTPTSNRHGETTNQRKLIEKFQRNVC